MKAIIYGKENCLGCNSLKVKLKLADIDFEFITDYDANFLHSLGYDSIPVLNVDGKYYDPTEANKWALRQMEDYKPKTFNPNADITIYGKNYCMACMAAKRILEQLGIEFNYISDYADDFLSNKGFTTIPVLNIHGQWYDNHQAAKWLEEYKNSLAL